MFYYMPFSFFVFCLEDFGSELLFTVFEVFLETFLIFSGNTSFDFTDNTSSDFSITNKFFLRAL